MRGALGGEISRANRERELNRERHSMDETKESASLTEEALLCLTREAREEALDRGEAPLERGELRARREREHGLELRGRELSPFALNRGEERGELRRGEHGRASGEGREQQGEKLLEHLLGLGSSLRRERLWRSEASLEAISEQSGLTARGEGELRPGEIRGEEFVSGHGRESERTEKERRGLPRGRPGAEPQRRPRREARRRRTEREAFARAGAFSPASVRASINRARGEEEERGSGRAEARRSSEEATERRRGARRPRACQRRTARAWQRARENRSASRA